MISSYYLPDEELSVLMYNLLILTTALSVGIPVH